MSHSAEILFSETLGGNQDCSEKNIHILDWTRKMSHVKRILKFSNHALKKLIPHSKTNKKSDISVHFSLCLQ